MASARRTKKQTAAARGPERVPEPAPAPAPKAKESVVPATAAADPSVPPPSALVRYTAPHLHDSTFRGIIATTILLTVLFVRIALPDTPPFEIMIPPLYFLVSDFVDGSFRPRDASFWVDMCSCALVSYFLLEPYLALLMFHLVFLVTLLEWGDISQTIGAVTAIAYGAYASTFVNTNSAFQGVLTGGSVGGLATHLAVGFVSAAFLKQNYTIFTSRTSQQAFGNALATVRDATMSNSVGRLVCEVAYTFVVLPAKVALDSFGFKWLCGFALWLLFRETGCETHASVGSVYALLFSLCAPIHISFWLNKKSKLLTTLGTLCFYNVCAFNVIPTQALPLVSNCAAAFLALLLVAAPFTDLRLVTWTVHGSTWLTTSTPSAHGSDFVAPAVAFAVMVLLEVGLFADVGFSSAAAEMRLLPRLLHVNTVGAVFYCVVWQFDRALGAGAAYGERLRLWSQSEVKRSGPELFTSDRCIRDQLRESYFSAKEVEAVMRAMGVDPNCTMQEYVAEAKRRDDALAAVAAEAEAEAAAAAERALAAKAAQAEQRAAAAAVAAAVASSATSPSPVDSEHGDERRPAGEVARKSESTSPVTEEEPPTSEPSATPTPEPRLSRASSAANVDAASECSSQLDSAAREHHRTGAEARAESKAAADARRHAEEERRKAERAQRRVEEKKAQEERAAAEAVRKERLRFERELADRVSSEHKQRSRFVQEEHQARAAIALDRTQRAAQALDRERQRKAQERKAKEQQERRDAEAKAKQQQAERKERERVEKERQQKEERRAREAKEREAKAAAEAARKKEREEADKRKKTTSPKAPAPLQTADPKDPKPKPAAVVRQVLPIPQPAAPGRAWDGKQPPTKPDGKEKEKPEKTPQKDKARKATERSSPSSPTKPLPQPKRAAKAEQQELAQRRHVAPQSIDVTPWDAAAPEPPKAAEAADTPPSTRKTPSSRIDVSHLLKACTADPAPTTPAHEPHKATATPGPIGERAESQSSMFTVAAGAPEYTAPEDPQMRHVQSVVDSLFDDTVDSPAPGSQPALTFATGADLGGMGPAVGYFGGGVDTASMHPGMPAAPGLQQVPAMHAQPQLPAGYAPVMPQPALYAQYQPSGQVLFVPVQQAVHMQQPELVAQPHAVQQLYFQTHVEQPPPHHPPQ